jgi:hypothetical protein
MRRLLLLILMVVLILALAACKRDKSSPANTGASGSDLGLFDWERDPNTIVVRLDSLSDQESPAFILNSIPPCTLWGDGRVVWTTLNATGAQDVLEARVDEAAVRAFLEAIINRGFYDWQDELVPPSTANPIVQSITVYLYGEVRTVRRFSSWPLDGYVQILESCRALSAQPVLVMPTAGWISAYVVPRDTMAPNWYWPDDAPFTLKELAENGESRWLEGDLATNVWLSTREDRGDIQVIERDGSAYQIAMAVPGYSRDAAPPPSEAGS